MLKLNFIVTEERVRLNAKKENNKTPSGNINNIECSFELPGEYDNLKVNAVFNGIPRAIENGKCLAPFIAAGECVIGVIAYAINDDNEYSLLSSPEPCVLYFSDGSYNENMRPDTQPTPFELELYYEKIERLITEKTVTDPELSADSSNAIANSAVAKVLGGGKLLGFEVMSDYADYCSFDEQSDKYIAGLENGGYLLILITKTIYQDDNIEDESQKLLPQGIYILKNDGEAILSLGEQSLNELLDELDTRYLSYDEWKTVEQVITLGFEASNTRYKELKEDVNAVQSQLFDSSGNFKGFGNSIELLTSKRNLLGASDYRLVFLMDRIVKENGFRRSDNAMFYPYPNDSRTVELQLTAQGAGVDRNASVIKTDDDIAELKLTVKNGSRGLPHSGDYRLVIGTPVLTDNYEIVNCAVEQDNILLIDSTSASKDYSLTLKLPYELNHFDVSLDIELQHNNGSSWEYLDKQTITVNSGDVYKFNTDDLTGVWYVPSLDKSLVRLSSNALSSKIDLTDSDKQEIANLTKEKWDLLIDDTLAEEVAVGTKYGWSTDINGNAYSAAEIFADIVFPLPLTTNIALQLNGNNNFAIMFGLLPAKTSKVRIRSKVLPNGYIETEYVYFLSTQSEISQQGVLRNINGSMQLSKFTRLSVNSRATNGSVALPAGTTIKIWSIN